MSGCPGYRFLYEDFHFIQAVFRHGGLIEIESILPGNSIDGFGVKNNALIRPACSVRRCTGRCNAFMCLNEYIHLLTCEDRQIAMHYAIDNLEHPRVNALGAVAGKRFFGNYIRLEAYEFQGCVNLAVAAQKGHCLGFRAHPPCIVLVYINTDVQGFYIAKEHEWRLSDTGGGELPKMDF